MEQVLILKSGAKVITKIIDSNNGSEIVTQHIEYIDGSTSIKTCTCTCDGGGSDSKTCDVDSDATCDCTGGSAVVSC